MTQPSASAKRYGTATLLSLCFSLCAACVTQNPQVEETTQTAPIVAKQHVLPPDAADRLLESALGEYGDDPAVRLLIDAVRSYAPAPLTTGNRVTALVDGPETFAAIRTALRDARHHIHVETFIFGDDELGREFVALLAQKRREGVAVRVLYDSVGSMDTPDAFFDEMRNQGIEVREFRPMNPVETPLIWKIQNRDHRKIIVVDGKVGFTGGINIDGTYASASTSKPGPELGIEDGWRDTHIRLDGPAVAQLQALFMQMWNKAGTPLTCDVECFPRIPNAGKKLVTIVANDSDSDDRSLYGTYLAAFTQARSRLWITQAYFAPNEELLEALSEAAKRGVDVRLIVPGFSDSSMVLQATRATYTQLLKSGVQVFERKDALLHAKSAVVDGAVSIVGSANLDMRSFVHNDEANAIVVSREFAKRMEEIFERDQKASRKLDLAKWKRRSAWQRFKEFGTKLWGYWL